MADFGRRILLVVLIYSVLFMEWDTERQPFEGVCAPHFESLDARSMGGNAKLRRRSETVSGAPWVLFPRRSDMNSSGLTSRQRRTRNKRYCTLQTPHISNRIGWSYGLDVIPCYISVYKYVYQSARQMLPVPRMRLSHPFYARETPPRNALNSADTYPVP
jgi:hypothetical protein